MQTLLKFSIENKLRILVDLHNFSFENIRSRFLLIISSYVFSRLVEEIGGCMGDFIQKDSSYNPILFHLNYFT